MRADTNAAARRTGRPARLRTVRTRSVRALLGPGIAALYLAATWDAPHRPAMAAVAGTMLAAAGLTWWAAPVLARSRWRVAVQYAGIMVNIGGSAALSLLDGGVGSPLGAMVPFSLLFYAIMMPPRAFAVASTLSAVAYWTVAVTGEPVPPGYAEVYTLGVAGVAYLCFRHAAALASLRHRLAEASRVDPLTRCLNRRGFDERLEQAVAEAVRTGRPMTLVLADLDRFKVVNDTYGHQAGDDVLAFTARTMSGKLRARDVLGRLGGDEFGAVLSDTAPADAPAVVQRLRDAVGGAVPASFGHASCPAEATTADELLRLADQRSYADKMSRRDTAPGVPDVARARAHAGRPATTAVARTERRRRSIADIGRLSASDCAVGLLYAAVLAGGSPHRPLIAVLCAIGLAYGLGMVAAAHRVSRSALRVPAMTASTVLLLPLAIVVPVLDGGVSSPTGLAILAPMPLVALGVRLRVALPGIAVLSCAYVAVAAAVGASGVWYVVMHLVGIMAVCAACAVQGRASARQRRMLTRLSQTDALTGIVNRRGFQERFAAELALARRERRPIGLLVVDLDGFKRLNDSAGHAAGDDLLRWVAATLGAGARPDGVVGRLGGDEFVMLLRPPATDPRTTAERLRAALAERTPASVGTAVLDAQDGSFAALYALADAELYREKAKRRPVAHERPAPALGLGR